jgi:hypothetical protein
VSLTPARHTTTMEFSEFPYYVLIDCNCSSYISTLPCFKVSHLTEPVRARVRELGGETDESPVYCERNMDGVHSFVRGQVFISALREHLNLFIPQYEWETFRLVAYPGEYAVRVTFAKAKGDRVHLKSVWRNALNQPEPDSLLAGLPRENCGEICGRVMGFIGWDF